MPVVLLYHFLVMLKHISYFSFHRDMCLKRALSFANTYDYDKKGCKPFSESNARTFFGKGKLG